MRSRVTDDRKRYDEVIRAIGDLGEFHVDVGIRQQDGEQIHTEGEPFNIAQIGAVHEFGASIRHGRSGGESVLVPERSFLRGWETEARDEAVKRLGKAVGRTLDGKGDPGREFGLVGEWAERGIRSRIRAGIDPELAPSTVRRKKSTTPLIDTGRLINSIGHEVGSTRSGGGAA